MKKTWSQSFSVYLKKESLSLLFLGFSSGLPLWLYYGPLSVWLSEAKVSRSTISFFSFVGLCYAFKWIWAPFVDRLPLPILGKIFGRRRSWMLVSQFGIIGGLIGMALTDPMDGLFQMAIFSVTVAFFSATQDIVVDAFRIELVGVDEQAALAATYMTGYRIAQILGGAGCLAIAQFFDPNPEAGAYDYTSWSIAYFAMAVSMLLGVITTLIVKEPDVATKTKMIRAEGNNAFERSAKWFVMAFVYPFVDFIRRYKWHAILILALISTYRISDVVLGIMANPFYTEIGFTKGEIASVSKVFGVIMTLVGALSAGALMPRFGIMKIMFVGALLSAATNLLFAYMVTVGHDISYLMVVISFDNLSGGLASAAFIAYMSGLTNISFTATQYALFTSVMLLLPKFIGGYSGTIVDAIGYSQFFIFTALIGVPVLILIILAAFYMPPEPEKSKENA